MTALGHPVPMQGGTGRLVAVADAQAIDFTLLLLLLFEPLGAVAVVCVLLLLLLREPALLLALHVRGQILLLPPLAQHLRAHRAASPHAFHRTPTTHAQGSGWLGSNG